MDTDFCLLSFELRSVNYLLLVTYLSPNIQSSYVVRFSLLLASHQSVKSQRISELQYIQDKSYACNGRISSKNYFTYLKSPWMKH